MAISRRKLIKLAGFASLTTATPLSRATSINKPRKLGVALVGLGYYSHDLLAPALQLTQHCELRGIVTGTPKKALAWQKQYGIPDSNVYNYDNMHEIADNPDIDVVYIVLPTSMHMEYAVIAANAGKHVWCEKPMAMNPLECQTVIDACNKNRVKLSIGYRLQHEPNNQTVIEYASSPPYGKIKQVNAHAGYAGGPPKLGDWRFDRKMGGGATYDMGVYPINAARYATGEEPIAVTARTETFGPKEFATAAASVYFTLEFPGGASAVCSASVTKNLNLLRVDCDNGWYQLEPFQSYSGVRGVTSDGIELNKEIPNQQAKQMDDNALAIINDRPVLVPGEEGMSDVRVVLAILKSADNDSVRVEI